MYLTLSKQVYVKHLLYRDFGGETPVVHNLTLVEPHGAKRVVSIHDEAITYCSQVLGRRLQLAQNLRDAPTTVHRLFETLCRCGVPAELWRGANVARALSNPQPDREIHPSLQPVAKKLVEQCKQLAGDVGDVSRRRRAEYGPIWLTVPYGAVEMPEEMSLFDVTAAVPKPLRADCLEASEFQHWLTRALKSLNEKYMLLRACGLRPWEWLERNEPSINELREMKWLRKAARALLNQGEEKTDHTAYRYAFDELREMKWLRKAARALLNQGEEKTDSATYRHAFDGLRERQALRAAAHVINEGAEKTDRVAYRHACNTLKDALKDAQIVNKESLTGCATFEAFSTTEHGMIMLGNRLLSLDAPINHDDGNDDTSDDTSLVETLADPHAEPVESEIIRKELEKERETDRRDWVSALIDKRPMWFSPVMAYFFREILQEGKPLRGGSSMPGLLEDLAFRHLIRQDPKYAGLSDDKLAEQLARDANKLIQRGRRVRLPGGDAPIEREEKHHGQS
jgi:hypothetical protein